MSISVFLQFARLSLTAGWMILVLLALRPLLKKVPRKFSCLLWALVAVRLAFPFSLESRVSMIPQAAASPLQIVDSLPPVQREQVFQTMDSAAANALSWNQIIPILWAVGIALMLAYAVVSFLRLHWLVRVSAPAGKGTYICDRIRTPFILGIAKPKIYLPSDLDEQTAASVLAHEQAHLRRGDHLWKPLGYALLSVYWFNPLCWVAYLLFCRDVEQACDEAVIRNMSQQEKKKYSAALLTCSVPRNMGACPLAFAEVGVKQRIAGIVNYRKPKFWVTVTAAVLCIALTAGLLTDPVKAANKDETAPAATEAASAAVAEPAAQAVKAAATRAVNIRLAPSLTSRAIAVLQKGQEVSAIRADTVAGITWVYVRLDASETTGWVVADYLNLDEEALGSLPSLATELPEDAFGTQAATLPSLENSIKTAATEAVNVRLAPNQTSRTLATLEKGEEVSAIGADVIGGITWVYISLDDQEAFGWAVADYLNLDEEALNSLPSMIMESPTSADTSGTVTASAPEGGATVTVKEATDLYSAPAESSRVVGQLEADEAVTVLRTDVISGTSWSYVSKTSDSTFGWVLTDCLNIEVAENSTPATQAQQSSSKAATAPTLEGDSNVTVTKASDLYSAPAENSRVVGQLDAGEPVTVLRTDVISGTSWSYVNKASDNTFGWVTTDCLNVEVGEIDEMPNALAYFMSYLESFTYLEPERTERYLYFASDADRQNFLDSYLAIADKATEKVTAISALADNLWCITWSDTHSFVGRMDGRLYVFPDVHNLPEQWLAGLDVSEYE